MHNLETYSTDHFKNPNQVSCDELLNMTNSEPIEREISRSKRTRLEPM